MGYGKLWWLFDDDAFCHGGPLEGAYTACGMYGQFITVVPKLDLVIAHKGGPGPQSQRELHELPQAGRAHRRGSV